jgi:MFS family permease
LAFTYDIYLVLASQLLDGMAYAFFASASVEMVKSYSKDETQATFQTVFAAITTGLGGIIGGAFGGIFIDHMGAPFLYFILFALCMTAAVLFIISNKMSNRSIKQDWQQKSQL